MNLFQTNLETQLKDMKARTIDLETRSELASSRKGPRHSGPRLSGPRHSDRHETTAQNPPSLSRVEEGATGSAEASSSQIPEDLDEHDAQVTSLRAALDSAVSDIKQDVSVSLVSQ